MALSLLPQAKRCPVPSSAAVISAAAVGALKQKLLFVVRLTSLGVVMLLCGATGKEGGC